MTIEIKDEEIISLFPTLIFKSKIEDVEFLKDLERKLRTRRSLGEGHLDGKNFISSDKLHEEDFKEFSNVVMDKAGNVLDFYHTKRDSHYISNMWGNIADPNHKHTVHIHPNCFLSGLLYVKTPENCSPTAFLDPRPGSKIFEPEYTERNEFNSGVFKHKATQGELIIWPHWLAHGVGQGSSQSKDERIVIAFNIVIHAHIKTKTAQLII